MIYMMTAATCKKYLTITKSNAYKSSEDGWSTKISALDNLENFKKIKKSITLTMLLSFISGW